MKNEAALLWLIEGRSVQDDPIRFLVDHQKGLSVVMFFDICAGFPQEFSEKLRFIHTYY